MTTAAMIAYRADINSPKNFLIVSMHSNYVRAVGFAVSHVTFGRHLSEMRFFVMANTARHG
jgi:hypothetical protein